MTASLSIMTANIEKYAEDESVTNGRGISLEDVGFPESSNTVYLDTLLYEANAMMRQVERGTLQSCRIIHELMELSRVTHLHAVNVALASQRSDVIAFHDRMIVAKVGNPEEVALLERRRDDLASLPDDETLQRRRDNTQESVDEAFVEMV